MRNLLSQPKSLTVILATIVALAGCSSEFNTKRRPGTDFFDVTLPSSVTGCTNFTVTIRAFDSRGKFLSNFNATASWSDLFDSIVPATPNPFINGVSTTTAQIVLPGVGNKITISSGGVSTESELFTVEGDVPSFPGLGFASVHPDRTFSLHWSPGFSGCGGMAGVTAYNIFEANSSGGQSFSSPTFSIPGAALQTQYVPDPGAGATKFYVARSLSGTTEEANSLELPVRFDKLALATLAGGRPVHDSAALSSNVRGGYIDLDSNGNLYFISGGSVGVLCLNSNGVCLGRTLGRTYLVSGSGGRGSLADADFSHGLNFTYNFPAGLRIDAQGNAHISDYNEGRDLVTCLSPAGVCGSTAGTSVDYSGTGSSGKVGNVYDGGTVASPTDLAFDSNGNIVYASSGADRLYVRCTTQLGWCANTSGADIVGTGGVPATVGNVYTLAGGGGALIDGGPATGTSISQPSGVAIDAFDNVVYSDTGYNRIRVVCKNAAGGMCARTSGAFIAAAGVAATPGYIYHVAGSGAAGSAGDNGLATAAQLNYPAGLRLNNSGDIIFADRNNSTVRVVCNSTTSFCTSRTVGNIYRIAGTPGTLGYSGDGGSPLSAVLSADYIALDQYDNVFVAGSGFVSGGDAGSGQRRNIMVRLICANSNGACSKVTGNDITPSSGIAATPNRIYRVMGDHNETVVAGNVDATKATLLSPTHATKDSAGNFVITASGNYRVQVVCTSTSGLCSDVSGGYVVAPGTGAPAQQNNVYTLAGSGWSVNSGDGSDAFGAGVARPYSSAVDAFDNIAIADYTNHTIRAVCTTPGSGICPATDAGGTTIVPGGPGTPVAGRIYRLAGTVGVFGYSGDGASALSARFSEPKGVAIDSSNNVILSDTNNSAVRVICLNASGPYCSSVNAGTGKVVDSGGVAATAGNVYTLAGLGGPGGYGGDGGAAYLAQLSAPVHIAVDSADNIAVSDTNNSRVRIICGDSGAFSDLCDSVVGGLVQGGGPAGSARYIYTVAGTGVSNYAGDGGASNAAELSAPQGVGFDAEDNLLISDTNNRRVRIVCNDTASGFCSTTSGGLIDPSAWFAGTRYNIYTIAGSGKQASAGDGYIASDATKARISSPVHAFADASGRLVIVDSNGNRVRFTF